MQTFGSVSVMPDGPGKFLKKMENYHNLMGFSESEAEDVTLVAAVDVSKDYSKTENLRIRSESEQTLI